MKAKDWIKELKSNSDKIEVEIDQEVVDEIDKKLKALEMIKLHIISPEYDTSGIYVERHLGLVEPYYEIKLREGVMCCLSPYEYYLIKEGLE